jgi:hypothetical protein
MLLAYSVLIILFIVIAVLLLILFKSDGADSNALRAIMCVGLIIIELIVIIGLIGSSKTGKIYRTEYDKLIQSIDKNKTKVIKEDDEITDIYITVNGEEYHFKFKEESECRN